ncbi:glycosyltransferase family 2 protein [Salinimonas sediminis]|uniref:Glycosyltransferase family 2 protein n=1 Tax=Salinimonas sediminis TaxID=2303538 RepID=A0A346NJE2_9ALTE|nr:glycosyltransferase family 2 protein [Salinimonas sediminis]
MGLQAGSCAFREDRKTLKVGAVIILYHPTIAHLASMLEALHALQWPVVLVDNSPVPLVGLTDEQADYIHCPSNVGIAQAQNVGLDRLVEQGAEAVLILDQDSQLSTIFLQQLYDAYEYALAKIDKLACVGPQIVCEFIEKPVQPKLHRSQRMCDQLESVAQIIASGMIVNVEAYHRVGKKDSNLFIDGVDHEWCWRARSLGFHVIKACNVKMRHRQGDGRHRILGLNFKRGAPVRLYYQVRNVLILSRRRHVPLYWKCRHLVALPVRWLVNRWWFPEGKLRGHYVRRGLIDGLKGRTGKLD